MVKAGDEKEHRIQKHKLLLAEFQAGVWTTSEYKDEVCKLNSPKPDAPAPSGSHGPSPAWDIETGGNLPSDGDESD